MLDKNYKILDETVHLLLGHVFENVYLTKKVSGENIKLGDIYGNPTCRLISRTNIWCVVGGSTLIVWADNDILTIKEDNLYSVHDIRQKGQYIVELLIDPWSANASIWEFNIMTKHKNKIKDFWVYKDKPYSENIVW